MGKQAQTGTYLGLALAGIGFLVIGLAWNGAAELSPAIIEGQFPYLISGGLSGLGLILLGVVLVLIQAMRRDGARRAAQMRELADAIAELQAQLAPGAAAETAVTGDFRPRPRRSNGSAHDSAGDALTEQIPQVVETRGRRSRA